MVIHYHTPKVINGVRQRQLCSSPLASFSLRLKHQQIFIKTLKTQQQEVVIVTNILYISKLSMLSTYSGNLKKTQAWLKKIIRRLLFYMQIRAHEASHKPLFKEIMRNQQHILRNTRPIFLTKCYMHTYTYICMHIYTHEEYNGAFFYIIKHLVKIFTSLSLSTFFKV